MDGTPVLVPAVGNFIGIDIENHLLSRFDSLDLHWRSLWQYGEIHRVRGAGKKVKPNANVVIVIRLVVRIALVSSTKALPGMYALFARNITQSRIYDFMLSPWILYFPLNIIFEWGEHENIHRIPSI